MASTGASTNDMSKYIKMMGPGPFPQGAAGLEAEGDIQTDNNSVGDHKWSF